MILILISILLSSIFILIGRNYTKFAFALSVFFLSLVAFLFDPYVAQSQGVYTDLVRFFNELQVIQNYNFNDVITSSVEPFKSLYPGMYVNNIIMFLVSKTTNLHLLPLLSVFSFYTILYIQLDRECVKNNVNKYNILLLSLLVYALIDITGPMANIRNPFASLVGVILLYNNLINGNSLILTFIGYIIIFFIHPSSIIFPIINLVVKISNKWTKYILAAAIFIFSVFSYQISLGLLGVIPGGSILYTIINKLNAYSGGQADLISYGTTFQKSLLWLAAIVVGLVLYLFNKETKDKFVDFSNAVIFFIIIFVASSIFSVHIFFRFGFILTILILVMLPVVFNNSASGLLDKEPTSAKVSVLYFNLYILLTITIIVNFMWYFGTYAYRSINLGG